MGTKKYVLVVDDEPVNRKMLRKLLSVKYSVLEAENGVVALQVLEQYEDRIAAVMLDIVMPVMNGYEFLEKLRQIKKFSDLPVVVTTGSSGSDNEIKALELGAWDYVLKPYNPKIILFRLNNAIERSEYSAFEKLKYMSEHDMLTDLYNRNKFFDETSRIINDNSDKKFAFVRLDIERFKLVNSFFGTAKGDELLIYIAENIRKFSSEPERCTYCRLESDVFCICFDYDEKYINTLTGKFAESIISYNSNYSITPCFGIYIIDDNTLPIETIYTRSSLAARSCKGNRLERFAFYMPEMSDRISIEQDITNDMYAALDEHQFKVFFQPKYSLEISAPHGAEALVRWEHPVKGMVSPGEFIPVFEKNGFITKLDYYIWKQVCIYIRNWLDEGLEIDPVSVNVSRVDLYNPNFVKLVLSLTEKYNIPHNLLNLELTESAYSDNPVMVAKTMREFQQLGFVIMMDDFGCGYSSLNVLKDIAVDILKIDMKFFSKTEIEGRGESIIASVIRMAKWLNIPVVAEGVETAQQINFLRSVGCDYVQGYYFAKPMPYEQYYNEYVKLGIDMKKKETAAPEISMDTLFSTNPQMELLFTNMLQPLAIVEYCDGKFEIIRVNEAYNELMGYDDTFIRSSNPIQCIDAKYRQLIIDAFEKADKERTVASCEYLRTASNGKQFWAHIKLQYVNKYSNKSIMFVTISDVTQQKMIDFELAKYKRAETSGDNVERTMLIVDDVEVNRVILKDIFKDRFSILEAVNGKQAMDILKTEKTDIILLDLFMPEMDGAEFLKLKNSTDVLSDIPVVVITVETDASEQVNILSLGADDYIVKPFVKESVVKRVNNVMESSRVRKQTVSENTDK